LPIFQSVPPFDADIGLDDAPEIEDQRVRPPPLSATSLDRRWLWPIARSRHHLAAAELTSSPYW